MVAHLGGADRCGLVAWHELPLNETPQTNAADRAGIDDTLAAGGRGRLENMACAGDIGGIHGSVIAQPKMITGGDMKTPIAAPHRLFQNRGLGDITLHPFKFQPLQPAQIAARTQECLEAMSARRQLARQIGAHESRSSRKETFHAQSDRCYTKQAGGIFQAKSPKKEFDNAPEL